MKQKSLIAVVLALMLFALTACVKTQPVEPSSQTDTPTEQNSETNSEVSPSTEESSLNADTTEETDADAWKAEFEQSLFDNYDVVPDHYEYLENGVYQVYVEIDGKIVPYVAVNSVTGDYHG